MTDAVPGRPPYLVRRPRDVVKHRVSQKTGLRVSSGGVEELFRRGALPRRDRFLLPDRPEPVLK